MFHCAFVCPSGVCSHVLLDCVCVYQSHAEQPGMCSCDVVVDVAAAPQQLQQPALYVLSISRFAVLDQRLTALQKGVDAARVHTNTLLEGLRRHKTTVHIMLGKHLPLLNIWCVAVALDGCLTLTLAALTSVASNRVTFYYTATSQITTLPQGTLQICTAYNR